jgi:hypothetical protein
MAVYTGPPPRTVPLDSTGAEGYHLTYLPGTLTVEFRVPGEEPCSVRVELRNSGTQLERVLVDSVYSPGEYFHNWSRKDEKGEVLRPGLYYYKFYICGKPSTLKLDYRQRYR